MSDDETPDGTKALEQLQATLGVALHLVTELANDPLFKRMVAAFKALPVDDRGVIVGVLEREALGQALSRATGKPVGNVLTPNPRARLYVRSHDSEFDRRAFDQEGMMIADIRALRIATLIRGVPGIHTMFRDAMREALDHVDPSTWDVAEELLHDVLACIADARTSGRARGDGTEEPTPPDADADVSADADAKGPTRRS